jgi:ribosomal protein L11 methyltransferase
VLRVPLERAEEARADWLERFPAGFEEREAERELELVAYVDEELPPGLGDVAVERVEPGWEDGWRRFHRPVTVGRLWIGPPWETSRPGLLPVVIDPGRAFGTGAHPTTRLCLEWLHELRRGSLLDLGCGSGVLAIAAVKLGHAPVIALDIDPAAVEATIRNAAVNAARVDARLAAAEGEPLPAADAVVANIALAAAQEIAPRLEARVVVTSGYLARERPELGGFRHVGRRTADDWAADQWERE